MKMKGGGNMKKKLVVATLLTVALIGMFVAVSPLSYATTGKQTQTEEISKLTKVPKIIASKPDKEIINPIITLVSYIYKDETSEEDGLLYKGDMNRDGSMNGGDIDPWAAFMYQHNARDFCLADMNSDGFVDGRDDELFWSTLGGYTPAVPANCTLMGNITPELTDN
jgi:hypothetical protein